MTIPTYDDLPRIGSAQERHSWDVFGAEDELGCWNFLAPEQLVAAARTIETGTTISLNLPLDEPRSIFWSARRDLPLIHHVKVTRHNRDDRLDNFHLQGSTQWDAFSHARYREHGYYGGRDEAAIDSGALGIHAWAERGLFGRGVLLDVCGAAADDGSPIPPDERVAIDAGWLEATARRQGVELRPGDVVLVRTGWLEWYSALADDRIDAMRAAFDADRASFAVPGVAADEATVGWFWDHRVAAAATDTPTFEALPYRPDAGWAHHRLLALLGFAIGELWRLDALAAHCRATGRYDFFLASAPLHLPNGVGSPANAYAIF